jgi:hypothetical protein
LDDNDVVALWPIHRSQGRSANEIWVNKGNQLFRDLNASAYVVIEARSAEMTTGRSLGR